MVPKSSKVIFNSSADVSSFNTDFKEKLLSLKWMVNMNLKCWSIIFQKRKTFIENFLGHYSLHFQQKSDFSRHICWDLQQNYQKSKFLKLIIKVFGQLLICCKDQKMQFCNLLEEPLELLFVDKDNFVGIIDYSIKNY